MTETVRVNLPCTPNTIFIRKRGRIEFIVRVRIAFVLIRLASKIAGMSFAVAGDD